jgi:hypothetical protein
MSLPALQPPRPRFAQVASTCTSAITSSLWIAICAAAPEFIWQGLRIALKDPTWADLFSALLIGLILAFFVEPVMERIRDLLHWTRHRGSAESKPRNALYTASLSLAFALASVCLHDAITAFVSGHGAEHAAAHSGLEAGIMLVIEWAIVPLAITLAWLSTRQRWLAVPMGVIGGASPCLAGWLFAWSAQAVITTAIPCLLILGFGYRQARKEPRRRVFARCAHSVALVAAIWFAIVLLLDAILAFYHVDQFELYSPSDFWVDVRFYFGWGLGLMLAPSPFDRTADTIAERVD